MDIASHLLAFLGWFIGGLAGGAAGMGAGMIALPVMAMHIDVRSVVVVTLITGTFSSGHLVLSYRKHARRSDVQDLLLAAVPACIAGTLLLKILPRVAIMLSIAAMIAVFVGMKLFLRPELLRLPEARWTRLLAGAVTGLCHGGNSLSGPPLAIYVLLKQWDPDRARGNMSIMFLLLCIPTVASLLAGGMLTHDLILLSLSSLAGMALGQPLGVRMGKTMPGKTFERMLLCMLLLAAVSLAVKSALLF